MALRSSLFVTFSLLLILSAAAPASRPVGTTCRSRLRFGFSTRLRLPSQQEEVSLRRKYEEEAPRVPAGD